MDSMIFYRSFYEAIKELKNSDRVKLYDAVFAYALDGVEPKLNGAAKSLFTLIKPQIDANAKRKANGMKGGRPKKTIGYEDEKPMVMDNDENRKPTVLRNASNKKPNDNVNVNVNDNVNDNANVNVVEDFNNTCKSLPVPVTLTDAREEEISHLLERFTEDDFHKVFVKAQNTPFLVGDNNRGWRATFDWLITEKNFVRVLEGNFDSKDEYAPSELDVVVKKLEAM